MDSILLASFWPSKTSQFLVRGCILSNAGHIHVFFIFYFGYFKPNEPVRCTKDLRWLSRPKKKKPKKPTGWMKHIIPSNPARLSGTCMHASADRSDLERAIDRPTTSNRCTYACVPSPEMYVCMYYYCTCTPSFLPTIYASDQACPPALLAPEIF